MVQKRVYERCVPGVYRAVEEVYQGGYGDRVGRQGGYTGVLPTRPQGPNEELLAVPARGYWDRPQPC